MMDKAPILKFKTEKSNNGLRYILPQDRVDALFNMIDGQNGNALKLAIVLLGTKEGYGISSKWVCDHTGMDRRSYYRTRKYLEDIGIITINDAVIQLNI